MNEWGKWEDVREILDVADDLPRDDAMFLLAKTQTAFLASLVEDMTAIRAMLEATLPQTISLSAEEDTTP